MKQRGKTGRNYRTKQKRIYDKQGKPRVDLDYTNHGKPKYHPRTHKHRWNKGRNKYDNWKPRYNRKR